MPRLTGSMGKVSMNSKTKTLLLGIGGIALAIAIAAAVLAVAGGGSGQPGQGAPASGLTTVKGVVGSEKAALFEDEDAKQIFAKHGLDVQVTTSGSWEMADKEGLEQNDFCSPSSELAGQHVVDEHSSAVKSQSKPFYSPLALATSQKVLGVLAQNGMAEQQGGVWRVNMQAYLDCVRAGKRWTDLAGSADYPSSRNVMIVSTDIRSSNSALMYLVLASYVMNGDQPVTSDQAGAAQVDDLLGKLFIDQGYSQSSSAGPWESYLSKGPMNQPLTMIYESQFLETEILDASRISGDMALAYPSPTVLTDHMFISFSDNGSKVEDILNNDPDMAKVLARHGFRVNGSNSQVSTQVWQDSGIAGYASSDSFLDTAQAPTYDVLNAMLADVKSKY